MSLDIGSFVRCENDLICIDCAFVSSTAGVPAMRFPTIHRGLARFIGDDDGASLMEYALVAALASVIIIIAILAVLNSRT